jgi:hypothetical protein
VIDALRMPFFIVSLVLMVVILLVEVGSRAWIGGGAGELATPGIGIAYLALVDGILLYRIAFWGLAAGKIIPPATFGRLGGIVSFIVMLLLFLACIACILIAILLLTMLVALFLSAPFGTIAYLAAFGHFEVGEARVTLAFLMTLKIALVICLFLAQQTFLTNKTFLVLLATSLLANVIVSFLHEFMPRFLASILDALAAIVVGVLALIWALIQCIGSVSPMWQAVKGIFKIRIPQHT